MNILRQLVVAVALGVAGTAMAQGPASALPDLSAIAPAGSNGDVDMLTTHKTPAFVKPAAPGALPARLPFARMQAPAAESIPSGPHTTEAVPVVDVDAVESSEPAPPTPVAPEADPAQENPAEPTDLTSPIFTPEEGTLTPRHIVLRALNKVTAQSEMMTLKAGEKVKFGQLEITAVTCQVSSPTSQTDYAALLDISEKLPTKDGMKPLFRGWMYASSPSIAALEHPVYDVTMVECKTMQSAPKKDEAKPAKKAKK